MLGVQSDVLFPVTQQRELETLLKEARKCCIILYVLWVFTDMLLEVYVVKEYRDMNF